jgi:hypothetical protein
MKLIDWEKETPAVKKVCDMIRDAYIEHQKLTTQEQNRVNQLIDDLIPG